MARSNFCCAYTPTALLCFVDDHKRCGPTVYAPSHMGHARAYLSFDIIRRILESYFGYQVTLIMNITDLDDKIIDSANKQQIHHLELSSHWEAEFHTDMRNLGVQPPTVLTRVTEYMPEIVSYIGQLVEKKFAYEAEGSVYFDVDAFSKHHTYGKLAPEQIGNAALLSEGEGKLTLNQNDKRNQRDFALWKRTKPDEPQWESPWGPGRPGWHIECSVMASDALEKLTGTCSQMDVHSGGIDLKFPHHDNELAQSEAYCSKCFGEGAEANMDQPSQWVNYFLHAGHLEIKGLKMSKSLKNFVTIQQALEINSARQIRMLFLMHKYHTKMDYADTTMVHAVDMEKKFMEFFHNVKAVLRGHTIKENQHWDEAAVALQKSLTSTQAAVDAALKDDFNTPACIHAMANLIKVTNVYLSSEGTVMAFCVRNVATYLTRMLTVFGLVEDAPIGFAEGGPGSEATSREEVLAPVLDAVQQFRSAVRDHARRKDTGTVLKACDDFRDQALPPLGIRLEDKADGSVWKLGDPAALQLEVEQKVAQAHAKEAAKAERAAATAATDAVKKMPPREYMASLKAEDGTSPLYTAFDEKGVPTAIQGEPLNKNQSKKAAKLFQTQQTKYDKYLKSLEKK